MFLCLGVKDSFVSFLTFGGYRFLRLVVSFLTFGGYFSYVCRVGILTFGS